MKRKLQRRAASCILVCLCLITTMISAFAAENPTYVLSFRPGANGSFSTEAESYLSGFGTVQRSAAGNLFVEVPAGSPFPSGIVSYLQAESGYYYKGGLSGSTVNEDCDFVAEYGVLSGSGILYTVNFVDSASGTALAEPYQGYANAGDVLTFSARTLAGYAVDSASKSLTVTDGAVLDFLYTDDGSNDQTNYVYGEDTIITQTVVVQPAAETGAETGNDADTPDQDTEVIDDNDIPLDNGSDTADNDAAASDVDTEDIPDSDVPLAEGETAQGSNAGLIIGVSAGAVVLLAILAAILIRKKSRG